MKKVITFNLKGGNLPDGFETKITAEIDYSGISETTLIDRVTSGQSDRVRLQAQLRKEKPATLLKYAAEGYKIRWDEIGTASPRSMDDLLMALNPEQFHEKLSDWGIDDDQIIKIYAKKHGMDIEKAEEIFLRLFNEAD